MNCCRKIKINVKKEKLKKKTFPQKQSTVKMQKKNCRGSLMTTVYTFINSEKERKKREYVSLVSKITSSIGIEFHHDHKKNSI